MVRDCLGRRGFPLGRVENRRHPGESAESFVELLEIRGLPGHRDFERSVLELATDIGEQQGQW